MVVETALPVLRIVLAGIQQGRTHEFDIVQRRPAVRRLDLVIPVHYHALVAGVHAVVVDILFNVHDFTLLLALQLRIFAVQQVVVHQIDNKQVPTLLDVCDARLPEQIQQVDVPDLDVPQTVVLPAIPEHAVGRRAVLQLLPPVVRVNLLKVVILLHHRQYLTQRLGALLVALFPWKHHRLRVVVHGVGVFVLDGVKEPRGRGLRLRKRGHFLAAGVNALGLALANALPVPQLPPQFVVDDAVFQAALAVFILGQQVNASLHVPVRDSRRLLRPFQQHSRHFR